MAPISITRPRKQRTALTHPASNLSLHARAWQQPSLTLCCCHGRPLPSRPRSVCATVPYAPAPTPVAGSMQREQYNYNQASSVRASAKGWVELIQQAKAQREREVVTQIKDDDERRQRRVKKDREARRRTKLVMPTSAGVVEVFVRDHDAAVGSAHAGSDSSAYTRAMLGARGDMLWEIVRSTVQSRRLMALDEEAEKARHGGKSTRPSGGKYGKRRESTAPTAEAKHAPIRSLQLRTMYARELDRDARPPLSAEEAKARATLRAQRILIEHNRSVGDRKTELKSKHLQQIESDRKTLNAPQSSAPRKSAGRDDSAPGAAPGASLQSIAEEEESDGFAAEAAAGKGLAAANGASPAASSRRSSRASASKPALTEGSSVQFRVPSPAAAAGAPAVYVSDLEA